MSACLWSWEVCQPQWPFPFLLPLTNKLMRVPTGSFHNDVDGSPFCHELSCLVLTPRAARALRGGPWLLARGQCAKAGCTTSRRLWLLALCVDVSSCTRAEAGVARVVLRFARQRGGHGARDPCVFSRCIESAVGFVLGLGCHKKNENNQTLILRRSHA